MSQQLFLAYKRVNLLLQCTWMYENCVHFLTEDMLYKTAQPKTIPAKSINIIMLCVTYVW